MNKQEELQQAYVIEVCNQINITTCRLQRLQQKMFTAVQTDPNSAEGKNLFYPGMTP
jgi:hypothetical protein